MFVLGYFLLNQKDLQNLMIILVIFYANKYTRLKFNLYTFQTLKLKNIPHF